MNHDFFTAEDCARKECPGCFICNGGLAYCRVCRGAEGSLTTECPGVPLTDEQERRIYEEGTLDFRNGAWVNEPNPTNQTFPRITG